MLSLNLLFRSFLRSLRARETRVVLFALAVAVGSYTAVSFFGDRVNRAITLQAAELIGGDVVLIADRPIPAEWTKATEGFVTARTTTLASMAVASEPVAGSVAPAEDRAHLVELRAVNEGFPLRGSVRIADTAIAALAGGEQGTREARGIPAKGEVWLAPALADRLKVQLGSTIQIGELRLKVAAFIVREPDSALDYFGIAPRALINVGDLPASGLIQPGSRVTYRVLVQGEPGRVAGLIAELKPTFVRGQRLQTPGTTGGEVQASMKMALDFLLLASVFSVALAAAAVALGVRRYSERRIDQAALMRCLGASRAQVFWLAIGEFTLIGLLGSGLGIALGLAAQALLAELLAGLQITQLPTPSINAAGFGLILGMVLTLGFTLPALFRLSGIPALRVLRKDLPVPPFASWAAAFIGTASLVGFVFWMIDNQKLAAIVCAGFLGVAFLGGLLGWIVLWIATRIKLGASGSTRIALANLARRPWLSVLQIGSLALGILALLLLAVVQGDLMARWKNRIPPDAANRFAINIQADQLPAVRAFFAAEKLTTPDLYPMVRGRLVEINGKKPPEEKRSYREFNLTYTDKPSENEIVAGQWWAPGATDAVSAGEASVEEKTAKEFNIVVGDRLTFDVAGTLASAKVTSLRRVNWDTFRPNFFIITNPPVLQPFAASHITSFRVAPGQESAVNRLAAQFSNVSVIDVSAIIAQVERITGQVTRAVEFVFLFALLSGGVVLYAAIVATEDERRFEGAVMRTLGASARQLISLQAVEFAVTGLCAGLVAALGAMLVGYALADRLLQVAYWPSANLWWFGPVGGTVGVMLAGLVGTRRVVRTPPVEALRSIA